MSKTTFTTNGVLVFPDLGKDDKVKGPHPGLNVIAKRTIKDAEFSLNVPVHTAYQNQSLNGTVLAVKSNYNGFETKAGVDLGTKYKTAGTLYKKKFDSPGRILDLEALWAEKGSAVSLGALYKLDTQKKASVKYDVTKQLALLTLGYEKNGFTFEPAIRYDPQTQQADPILSLSQKNGPDTLKASYDINKEAGSLEWNRKPYKIVAKAPIHHKGGFKAKAPTVMLHFSKDFEAGGNSVSKRSPDSLEVNRGAPGSLVALEEARQGPLADRLRAIDAVNLEKQRDLTASSIRKNREGNKGYAAGHD